MEAHLRLEKIQAAQRHQNQMEARRALLRDLQNISPEYRTEGQNEDVEYYETFFSPEIHEPRDRSLERQCQLLAQCRYGTTAYETELLHLFEITPDETNERGNRAKQVEMIGYFLAPLSPDPEFFATITKKLESFLKSTQEIDVLLRGMESFPGFPLNKQVLRPLLEDLKK